MLKRIKTFFLSISTFFLTGRRMSIIAAENNSFSNISFPDYFQEIDVFGYQITVRNISMQLLFS